MGERDGFGHAGKGNDVSGIHFLRPACGGALDAIVDGSGTASICVYIRIHVHTDKHACTNTRPRTNTRERTHAQDHVTSICIHAHAHMCTHVRVCEHVHTHIPTHTHTHIINSSQHLQIFGLIHICHSGRTLVPRSMHS